jgi:hypothetical protein
MDQRCIPRRPARKRRLVTRDAHGLYEQVGFRRPAAPAGIMKIARPGMYRPRGSR